MKSDQKPSFSWLELLRFFWSFVTQKRKQLIALFVILSLTALYEMFPPFILGKVVDFFTSYKQGQSLDVFFILLLAFGLCTAIVAIIRLRTKLAMVKIRNIALYNIKVQGFQNLLNHSLEWHDQENTGNKVQKINNGAQSIKDLFKLLSNELMRLAVAIVSVSLVFLTINFKYALILFIYMGLFYIIQNYFYAKYIAIIRERNIAEEKASGKYYEGITNILSVKSLGAKGALKSKISIAEGESKIFADKLSKVSNTKWQVFQITNVTFYTTFLLFLGLDVANAVISIGAIIVYWQYLSKITDGLADFMIYYDQLVEIKENIGRMVPIYNCNTEKEYFGKGKFPKAWHKLAIIDGAFKHVSAEQQFAMSGINFEVLKNQKIGIAGQTGSGKSTLSKLLLGLYALNSGKFLIDEKNYYSISEEEIRDNITIVLQESELFNLSLLDNITMMREVDLKLLEKVIRISKLDQVIAKLPEGLDTMIGEKGYRVSGGERQRIGIARALYRNTPILIFDEATSNLDAKTEREIQDLLDSELQTKTIIFIAHRVSTLKNVDKIYIFKAGRIVEFGSFDELMSDSNSEFARLNKSLKD